MKGIVFDIRRFCIHDGPGIRTTVFLKGCLLRCAWCHNPESQSQAIEMMDTTRSLEGKQYETKKQIGREMTVEQLIDELSKDEVFYDESCGGITFSGGEPMLQSGFLLELLKACKSRGYHTAVDSCGYSASEIFLRIMPHTDLFLYDLKHPSAQQHQANTGVDNTLILHNLDLLLRAGKKVIVRIPVIPGFNDSTATMSAMILMLKKMQGRIKEVNLLPFHEMGGAKYTRLHKKPYQHSAAPLRKENLSALKQLFEHENFTTKIGG